ncbi:MAG: ATP-dependent helicase HrpB [Desulfobacterales bacterium]|nr:ATP-dependent helicase HrpB [Desulfobacterales bacterium]
MQALPVTEILDTLKSRLATCPGAVLQAPPGAGKTTLVPPALLDEPWLAPKRILLLEPRRLAARAAARRMADLRGEPVGGTVGYRMRMDRRVGSSTRIEVVTEGVLTRMLQSDPGLRGIGLVIFDEFHERSLQADLGLTLCLDIQGVLNTDLRLLVMSATLEAETVAAFMGGVPVITCQGRVYPVATRYGNPRQRRGLEDRVANAVRRVTAEVDASILVFLPGAAEIGRAARRLAKTRLGPQWIIAPLYGRLTRSDQDRAIRPAPRGKRKIVLASAIAETSLTIEGIRVVVDAGFMRVPRYDPRSGMTRLVTLPVSKASADQRRGRAGRTAPGVCYRLWSEAEQAALIPVNQPEISVSDMTALALELALWGVSDPTQLRWLDPPPPNVFGEACDLLQSLEALDRKGRLTPHGRRMAALPVHPRLAHMLVMAKDHHLGRTACDLAAILGERDFVYRQRLAPDSDLQLRLDCLAALRAKTGGPLTGISVERPTARRVIKSAERLRRQLDPPAEHANRLSAGRLLAWAYPDRIAQRRITGEGRFRLTNGRGAFLDPREPLAAQDFIVAAELDGDRRDARIFLAAAYGRDDLTVQNAERLVWREHVDWDKPRQRVRAERRLVLGALTLRCEPLGNPDLQSVQAAFLKGVRECGLDCLPWSRKLRGWQARVNFVHRILNGRWPDLSDAHLTTTLEQWLGPHITGYARLRDLKKLDLHRILSGRLDWRQQKALDRLAPTHLSVPSGRRIPIDYHAAPPILAVRLQEMFGQEDTPVVADGRQPLVIHLLSPAGRPVQITQDLAGFWQKGYNAVRKDLRGRYPKHYWPEDPLKARATHRVKPRKS